MLSSGCDELADLMADCSVLIDIDVMVALTCSWQSWFLTYLPMKMSRGECLMWCKLCLRLPLPAGVLRGSH